MFKGCLLYTSIKEDQVPAALDAMRLFKMRGCNVTMPCKNKVAQCVDELSPAAKIIGAVNTIVNEDGKLVGHITDGIGFVRNLKEHGVDVKGKKMVVLGAGGAATALTVQCALDGAASVSYTHLDVYKRQCHKRMEMLLKGKEETFVCQCGYKEKLSSFQARRAKEGAGVNKRDVQRYLKKQQKEANEPVNNAFAQALSGIKLD